MAQIKIANEASLEALASSILSYYKHGGNIITADEHTCGLVKLGSGLGTNSNEPDCAVVIPEDNTITVSSSGISVNTTQIATREFVTNLGYQTASQVSSTVSGEIAKVVGGAPETFDTLKEIADYITTHGSEAAAMTASISALENSRVKTTDIQTMTSEDIELVWANALEATRK